jgi:hypothetical protein
LGAGSGLGSGYGAGYGAGYGIKEIAGHRVYEIDDTPTVVYSVRGNIAKGATIRNNTELVPCYIVREGDAFAHGATLREAFDAVQEKAYDDTPVEERISAFCEAHDRVTRYPARELYKWHHILTGSCKFGRDEFVKAHDIDLDNDTYTVAEFITICEGAYGGPTIKKLREFYG